MAKPGPDQEMVENVDNIELKEVDEPKELKQYSPDLSPADNFKEYMGMATTRAPNKHFDPPMISHLDALKTFLIEDDKEPKEENEIQRLLEKQARKDVREITKYNVLEEEHKDREAIAAQVIKIVKIKLADLPATKENVLAVLRELKSEVEEAQLISSGKKTKVSKPVVVSNELSKVSASLPPLSEDPSKKPIAQIMKEVDKSILLAYLSHACKVPSAIAYEVRYHDINEQTLRETAEVAGKLANAEWDALEKARMERLEAIMPKMFIKLLAPWKELTPLPLKYDEMELRDEYRQYKVDESKKEREENRRKVNGYEPQIRLNKQTAVALNTAQRFRREDKVDITRQYAEHPEKTRVEMQLRLGILPVSTSRQETFWGKASSFVGGTDYKREFPAEEVRLDEAEVKKSYKERRTDTEKRLETFCPMHQTVQAVRLKEKELDPGKDKVMAELCKKVETVLTIPKL